MYRWVGILYLQPEMYHYLNRISLLQSTPSLILIYNIGTHPGGQRRNYACRVECPCLAFKDIYAIC